MFACCRALAVLLLMTLPWGCAEASQPTWSQQGLTDLSYQLTPVLVDRRLKALDVHMDVAVPPSGVVKIKPPQGIGQDEPSDKVIIDTVRFGRITVTSKKWWLVRANRGQHRVQIDYRINPATGADSVGGAGYKDVLMGNDWFQALGENLFAAPMGYTDFPAKLRWQGPPDWSFVSPLENLEKAGPVTLKNLLQTTAAAGAKVQRVSRSIRDGTLTVVGVGYWALPLDKFADVAASVISAQRAFWKDTNGPYFVTVVAMNRDDDFNAGVGRDGAFAAYVAREADMSNIRKLITHEYTHMWIPTRTGRMPDGNEEPLAYWFSEGFTAFRTSHAMLQSGAWTIQDFANDFNSLSTSYDMSPARHIANRDVMAGFWRSNDVQAVPYQRGAILAWMLDARLRKQTGGQRDMHDVLLRMRDRYIEDPRQDVRTNLVRSYAEEGGGPIDDWLNRFIDQGEQMILPVDLFSGCLKMLEENKAGIGRVQSVMVEPGLSARSAEACVDWLGR